MALDLTDEQKGKLQNALIGAYLNPDALKNAIWIKTGIDLSDYFSLNAGKKDVVSQAIQLAQGQGWLEQLVRAAVSGAPHSVPLRNIATSLRLAPPPDNALPPLAAPTDNALQEFIRRRYPLMPMKFFTEGLQAISRAVCWIGLRDDKDENPQFGTGFLVGPDLMLTNYHVVDRIMRGAVERGAVVCRFDHLSTKGDTGAPSAGFAEEWCLDKAPPAPSDAQTDGREPTEEELDYALVRLDAAIGQSPFGADGKERGWLQIAAEPPPLLTQDILYVVQHPAETMDPEEGTQRIAAGIVLGFDTRSLRIRYDANTTDGSSGSPAFTADLRLAALHQGTEPLLNSQGHRAVRQRSYNRGIPLRPILKRMRAKGMPRFWENPA
jgi:hypothetical protein